jgi:hypothetical protein
MKIGTVNIPYRDVRFQNHCYNIGNDENINKLIKKNIGLQNGLLFGNIYKNSNQHHYGRKYYNKSYKSRSHIKYI